MATHEVCIDSQMLNKIENVIITFIENKIKEDFDKFVYGTLS